MSSQPITTYISYMKDYERERRVDSERCGTVQAYIHFHLELQH